MEKGRKFYIMEIEPHQEDYVQINDTDILSAIKTALYQWRHHYTRNERKGFKSYYICSMIPWEENDEEDDEEMIPNWVKSYEAMEDVVDIIELDKWLSKRRNEFKEEYPDDYYDEEKDIELYLKEQR